MSDAWAPPSRHQRRQSEDELDPYIPPKRKRRWGRIIGFSLAGFFVLGVIGTVVDNLQHPGKASLVNWANEHESEVSNLKPDIQAASAAAGGTDTVDASVKALGVADEFSGLAQSVPTDSAAGRAIKDAFSTCATAFSDAPAGLRTRDAERMNEASGEISACSSLLTTANEEIAKLD
jgi:hypothetical protein